MIEKIIYIEFGETEHGWLPVDFRCKGLQLDFYASMVINDPIKELLSAITNLKNTESIRTTWWLEPAAYFFDFRIENDIVILEILETDNLFIKELTLDQIFSISGTKEQIIEPFLEAARKFATARRK